MTRTRNPEAPPNLDSTRDPAASPQLPRGRPPDPPSWLDRLAAALDRLPAPPWAVYAFAFLVLGLASHLPTWLDGSLPWWGIDPQHILIAAWCVFPIALKHHLDNLARASFDQFEPCLGLRDEAAANLRGRLTQLRPRPALLAGALGALSLWLLFLLSPALFATARSSTLNTAVSLTLLTLNFALVAAMVYQTFHQLAQVSLIYSMARRIDLYHLEPFYAFSNLTARTGILWAIMLSVSVAATPGALASPLALSLIVLQGVAVIAAFSLPLLGIHGRIAAEKSVRLGEAGLHLENAVAELHRRSERLELGEMDAVHKMILSLIAEREVLQKTPSWPWQPETPVAVVTALLLPMGLFLLQRLLERLIGS